MWFSNHAYPVLVERVPQIWFSGTSQNHLENKLNKDFLHFFVKFLPYLMIFQSSAAPSAHSTLKNHQIWQTMMKNLVQLAVNTSTYFSTILRLSDTRDGFWVPILALLKKTRRPTQQPTCFYKNLQTAFFFSFLTCFFKAGADSLLKRLIFRLSYIRWGSNSMSTYTRAFIR